MQLLEQLTRGGGQNVVSNLAAAYGIPPETAQKALEALLPEFSRAVAKNTLSRGGLADIVDLLGRQDFQRYLSPGADLSSAGAKAAGIDVLAEIFRSRDTSRAVAARAARQTGLGEGLIKEMLPQIAAIAMGGITKQMQSGLGDILGRMPNAGAGRTAGMAANVGQQQPLPMPGDDMLRGPGGGAGGNPYGDLGDLIRKRGRIDGQRPGNLVRDILGQVLGFQNKGLIGWIVQFIIARYGWSILRAILGRVLAGR